MRLVYKKTQEEVKVGDTVTLRGGDKAKVINFSKPHKPSSAGFVLVEFEDGDTMQYYVTVIDAEWIEREDRIGW